MSHCLQAHQSFFGLSNKKKMRNSDGLQPTSVRLSRKRSSHKPNTSPVHTWFVGAARHCTSEMSPVESCSLQGVSIKVSSCLQHRQNHVAGLQYLVTSGSFLDFPLASVLWLRKNKTNTKCISSFYKSTSFETNSTRDLAPKLFHFVSIFFKQGA